MLTRRALHRLHHLLIAADRLPAVSGGEPQNMSTHLNPQGYGL